MTDRLYYQDSYLCEFDAAVCAIRNTPRGRSVLLDRTAFYPTSGGQPHDEGWLGVARVVGVEEAEDGQILHYIEGDIAGGALHGSIDWKRRYDHMQQHSGQHLLSQAFVHTAAAPTLSFHLGEETCTIDVEASELPQELLLQVEEEANRRVFENLTVAVHFVPGDRVQELNLRKEPSRQGTLRIVEIEGYDRSACGGTHIRRTGELGLIHITSVERYKSNQRVEFVCGRRALARVQRQREILKALCRQCSTGADELSTVFQKLSEENREQGRRVRDLEDRIAEFEAELLFQTAERHAGVSIIKAVLAPCPANNLKYLASKLLQKGPCVVLLASGEDSAFVVLGNSSPQAVDSGGILSRTLRLFGGRGGGRPELAQGGGIPGGKAGECLDALQAAVLEAGRT